MNKIIDGLKISSDIKKEIKDEISLIKQRGDRVPSLSIVLVGNHSASSIYVNAKIRACEEVGINVELISLNDNILEVELLDLIRKLNNKKSLDGFIVQLPLPDQINVQNVIDSINPNKDVDGFTNDNIGSITSDIKKLLPATGLGVMTLIERYKIDLESKSCAILGSSRNVGAAIAQMLMQREEVTVTVCNSKTKNLKNITKKADLIISAVGKPNLVTSDMVKDGVVIIDVGISRVRDKSKKSGFKIVGDVDYDNVFAKASMITPVPGGVGPMTIASLIQNTLKAHKNNEEG
jgi:methylenetetrahydrofolate dehydrogenase (NADP+)/methenyltetrahydrofolate cyclohydrolase|tara:strand:+ start:1100 stop:1975 length:876 start_codon:yes stop_codon:yes gene_type:complete